MAYNFDHPDTVIPLVKSRAENIQRAIKHACVGLNDISAAHMEALDGIRKFPALSHVRSTSSVPITRDFEQFEEALADNESRKPWDKVEFTCYCILTAAGECEKLLEDVGKVISRLKIATMAYPFPDPKDHATRAELRGAYLQAHGDRYDATEEAHELLGKAENTLGRLMMAWKEDMAILVKNELPGALINADNETYGEIRRTAWEATTGSIVNAEYETSKDPLRELRAVIRFRVLSQLAAAKLRITTALTHVKGAMRNNQN